MNQNLNGSPAHETGNKELAVLEPHEFAPPMTLMNFFGAK